MDLVRMSSNTVSVRLDFSFQAETYAFESCIDLDACLATSPEAPDFHRLLAQQNGVDPYSYRYEVLESHTIEFVAPTGLAVRCCQDGGFDWGLFVELWREETLLATLRTIALQRMRVENLDECPDLASALRDAYSAGRAART
jgi:hypothetical protein